MTALLRDLRLAVRVLLHTKSWTLVVLVSLALGHRRQHGAVHRGQRPAAADRVACPSPSAWSGSTGPARTTWSGARATTATRARPAPATSGRRSRSRCSSSFAPRTRPDAVSRQGRRWGTSTSSSTATPSSPRSYQASGNYFTVIGVPAALGRVFREDDDRLSAPPVAVISHAYWQKRFGGQPSAIDRVVSINGRWSPVIGVTPPDFTGIQRLGAEPPDVTVPLAFDAVFSPPTPVPGEQGADAAPARSRPTGGCSSSVA